MRSIKLARSRLIAMRSDVTGTIWPCEKLPS
jgi:hypothetical protein